jgi:hypothetical protein
MTPDNATKSLLPANAGDINVTLLPLTAPVKRIVEKLLLMQGTDVKAVNVGVLPETAKGPE